LINEFLTFVRDQQVRESELVAKYGKKIIKHKSTLGDDIWDTYEQVLIAALAHGDDVTAEECFAALYRKFPTSVRVQRLSAMRLEAKGSYGKAEDTYKDILEKDPTDQISLKRLIAIEKANDKPERAITLLNKYLNVYMADVEAWQELADLYCNMQLYENAAYCYEELILASPNNYHIYVRYAELLYTMGGADNLELAKKYYSYALELSQDNNVRALYGLLLTLKELALKSAPSKAHTDLAASTRSKLDKLYARSELSAVVKTVLDKLNSPETKDKKDKQSQ
jgi:tetratricopeptide (TPR) repeat protein